MVLRVAFDFILDVIDKKLRVSEILPQKDFKFHLGYKDNIFALIATFILSLLIPNSLIQKKC